MTHPHHTTAVIFDCEFLTAPGAPQRFWCGPDDPDPVVAQIGAVKLNLTPDAAMGDTFECLVQPPHRFGDRAELDPLFQDLTGITQARMDAYGRPLSDALDAFRAFAEDAPLWSWGKDGFNMLAISCYVAGLPAPIPAWRFGNATKALRAAGIAPDIIHTLRSNTLPAHFDLPAPDRPSHDALGDAQAVAAALQHLIRTGALAPERLSDTNI